MAAYFCLNAGLSHNVRISDILKLMYSITMKHVGITFFLPFTQLALKQNLKPCTSTTEGFLNFIFP